MLSAFLALMMLDGIILAHELGHAGMAWLLRIPVREISLGFGPLLLRYRLRRSGLRLSLRLIPVGGFCTMEFARPVRYFGRRIQGRMKRAPAFSQCLVFLAGPAVNLLLGVLLKHSLDMAIEREVVTHGKSILDALNALFASTYAGQIVDLHGPIGLIIMLARGLKTGSPVVILLLGWAITRGMGLFNLLPVPGLDGGQVLELCLNRVWARLGEKRRRRIDQSRAGRFLARGSHILMNVVLAGAVVSFLVIAVMDVIWLLR